VNHQGLILVGRLGFEIVSVVYTAGVTLRASLPLKQGALQAQHGQLHVHAMKDPTLLHSGQQHWRLRVLGLPKAVLGLP